MGATRRDLLKLVGVAAVAPPMIPPGSYVAPLGLDSWEPVPEPHPYASEPDGYLRATCDVLCPNGKIIGEGEVHSMRRVRNIMAGRADFGLVEEV